MKGVRGLFLVAALYDGLLGVAGLFFHERIYDALNIPPPNHVGYVHFPASVVLVMGIAFLLIATRPKRNRDLILVGILFKCAYAGVVLYHHFTAGIPMFWTVFAWCDVVFAAAFVWAWRKTA